MTAPAATPFASLPLGSTDPRDANLVINEVVPGIVTFSIPFARFDLVPIGGRSTVIRLQSGELFVYCSHPHTAATVAALQQLGGEVKWIVTPDAEHTINTKAWADAYPAAQVIGVRRLGRTKPEIRWAGLFGAGGETQTYGFEREITLLPVSAHRNSELAALHAPSRTLLEGDLLFNLPATEQYARAGGLPLWARLLGGLSTLSPGGILHARATHDIITDKDKARVELAPFFAADFDRIIPCHGDVINSGGRAAWDKVWGMYKSDPATGAAGAAPAAGPGSAANL